MASEQKKRNMKHGAIIGAIVGVAVFAITYSMNESLVYLIFIPIAAAMGWAIPYTRVEDDDD
jgi:uncharacterized membrane protein YgaE (UPF0421/DUF939 family)